MGCCKCLFRSLLVTAAVIAIILLIPNFPPYVDVTQPLSSLKQRSLVGPLALNEKLSEVEIIHKGKVRGPEAFDAYNGELYTSTHLGLISRVKDNQIVTVFKTGKPCKGLYQEHICGRPLGFKFKEDGTLIVADAYYGLLKVNLKTEQKEILVSPNTKINGKTPKVFNSVALARNGDIYWSVSSSQFYLHDLVFDALADPSGRLIHYDSKTKKNTVLIDNISFANGVALSQNEDFVLVAESLGGRILRYYLKGPKKGTQDVFIDSLPGLPDNIGTDGKEGFLIPIVSPMDEEHPSLWSSLRPFPLIRKFLIRLLGLFEFGFETLNQHYPTEFGEKALHFIGHFESSRFLDTLPTFQMVIRVNENGDIIDSVSATNGKIQQIAEAFIFNDYLWLGSPVNDYIARIPLKTIGWSDLALQQPKLETTTSRPSTTTVSPKREREASTEKPREQAVPKQQTPPAPKMERPPHPQQQTTSSPPRQQTTPPPRQQPTTTPPPREQTTPPPRQQPTTTPPPRQQTTPPLRQASTPPPRQQTTSPPRQQQTTTPPPRQQTTTSPPRQQTTPPPRQQQTTTPPLKQQTTPPPRQQQTTPLPKQQTTTPPPKQQKTTSPPRKQTTAPLPKQQVTTPLPPKQQTPPTPKQQTPPTPKQQTPPTPKQQTPTPAPKQAAPSSKQGAPSSRQQTEQAANSQQKQEAPGAAAPKQQGGKVKSEL